MKATDPAVLATASPRLKKLARLIARARKRLGLNQIELAEKCKVSPGTIGAWETARHGIQTARMSHVAQVLQLEVTELIG